MRGTTPGPLFIFSDKSLLMRQHFVGHVHDDPDKAGMDQSKYCGCSVQIGTVTAGAEKGIEDCIIRNQGDVPTYICLFKDTV